MLGSCFVAFVWLIIGSIPIPKFVESIVTERAIEIVSIESMEISDSKISLDIGRFRPEIHFTEAEIQLMQGENKVRLTNGEVSFSLLSLIKGSFVPTTITVNEITIAISSGELGVSASDGETGDSRTGFAPLSNTINILESLQITTLELIEFKKIIIPYISKVGQEELTFKGLFQLVRNETGFDGNYYYPDESEEAKVKLSLQRYLNNQDISYRLNIAGDASILNDLINTGKYQPEINGGLDYGTVLLELNTNQPYETIEGSFNVLDSNFEIGNVLTPWYVDSMNIQFQYLLNQGTINLETMYLRSNLFTSRGDGTINLEFLNEGIDIKGKTALETILADRVGVSEGIDHSGKVSFAFLIPFEGQTGRYNIETEFTGFTSDYEEGSLIAYLLQENSKFIGNVSGELSSQRTVNSLNGHFGWINDPDLPANDARRSSFGIPLRYDEQIDGLIAEGINISVAELPLDIDGKFVLGQANINANPSYYGVFDLREKTQVNPLPKPVGNIGINGILESEGLNFSYNLTLDEGSVSIWDRNSPAFSSTGNINLNTLSDDGIGIGGSIELALATSNRNNELQVNFAGELLRREFNFDELLIELDPVSLIASGKMEISNDESSSPFSGLFDIRQIDYRGSEQQLTIGSADDIKLQLTLDDENISGEITAPQKLLSTLYSLQVNEVPGLFQQRNGEGQISLRAGYNWITSEMGGEFKGSSLVLPVSNNNLHVDNLYLSFNYPLGTGQNIIKIDELSADSDHFSILANGNLYAGTPNFYPQLVGNIFLEKGTLKKSQIFEETLDNITGNFDLQLDLEKRQLKIVQAHIREKGAQVWGEGDFTFENQEKLGTIQFWSRNLDKDELIRFWPLNLVAKTRAWLNTNIHSGEINDLTGGLTLLRNEKSRLEVTYTFSDVDFTYLKGFPPIVNGSGYATLTENDLSLQMEEGYTEAFENGTLTLDGSSFYIPKITNNKIPSEVHLKVDGKIYPLFVLLDLDPFNFIAKANLTPVFVSGDAKGEIRIRFPLIDKITLDQITMEGAGEFSTFETIGLFYGKSFQSDRLKIDFDEKGLVIEGDGKFGNLPVQTTMIQNFEPGVSERLNINGSFEMSDIFFEEFNVDFVPEMVSGSSRVNFNLNFPQDAPAIMNLESDLYGSSVDIPVLDWQKSSEEIGRMEIGVRITNPLDLYSFEISAEGLDATGRLNLTQDGGFESFNFDRVELEDFYSGELGISLTENGNLQLEIPGTIELVDSEMLSQYTSDEDSDRTFNIYLGELKISPQLSITEITGMIQRDGDLRANFNGKMNGGATLNGWLFDREGSWMFRIASDNAGQVARDAEIIASLSGGKVWVDVSPGEEEGEFRGTIIISDITIPPFYELGSDQADDGDLPNEETTGIKMDQIRSNFLVTREKLVLNEAAGMGTQVGFSFSGEYSVVDKSMNFEGTVAPLRVITTLIKIVNPISLLIPRRISGEIGTFDFTLKGTLSEPDFNIEPTSIINPSNLTGFLFLNIAP